MCAGPNILKFPHRKSDRKPVRVLLFLSLSLLLLVHFSSCTFPAPRYVSCFPACHESSYSIFIFNSLNDGMRLRRTQSTAPTAIAPSAAALPGLPAWHGSASRLPPFATSRGTRRRFAPVRTPRAPFAASAAPSSLFPTTPGQAKSTSPLAASTFAAALNRRATHLPAARCRG